MLRLSPPLIPLPLSLSSRSLSASSSLSFSYYKRSPCKSGPKQVSKCTFDTSHTINTIYSKYCHLLRKVTTLLPSDTYSDTFRKATITVEREMAPSQICYISLILYEFFLGGKKMSCLFFGQFSCTGSTG